MLLHGIFSLLSNFGFLYADKATDETKSSIETHGFVEAQHPESETKADGFLGAISSEQLRENTGRDVQSMNYDSHELQNEAKIERLAPSTIPTDEVTTNANLVRMANILSEPDVTAFQEGTVNCPEKDLEINGYCLELLDDSAEVRSNGDQEEIIELERAPTATAVSLALVVGSQERKGLLAPLLLPLFHALRLRQQRHLLLPQLLMGSLLWMSMLLWPQMVNPHRPMSIISLFHSRASHR